MLNNRAINTWIDYFGARYYASDLSIWLSVDPLASRYPNVSPYMYVLGNPVRYTDPDGRWVKGAGFLSNIFRTDEANTAKVTARKLNKAGYKTIITKNSKRNYDVVFDKAEVDANVHSAGEAGIVNIRESSDGSSQPKTFMDKLFNLVGIRVTSKDGENDDQRIATTETSVKLDKPNDWDKSSKPLLPKIGIGEMIDNLLYGEIHNIQKAYGRSSFGGKRDTIYNSKWKTRNGKRYRAVIDTLILN